MDNAGRVVRIGDTVRRPTKPSSPAVRALLLHLEAVGFDGAPRYLGTDERGRQVLSYIEGHAPLPPYPAWAMTEESLAEVARLLRRFHEAAAGFDAGGIEGWSTEWADPTGGPHVCHNDPYPENVLFRDGRAVALIDFDLAAPGRHLWDVAVAGREWAPLSAPERRRYHPSRLDGVGRLGRFARAYGLDGSHASTLVDLLFLAREQMLAHIRSEIAAGSAVWIEEWQWTNGAERAAADDAWLAQHRAAMLAELTP